MIIIQRRIVNGSESILINQIINKFKIILTSAGNDDKIIIR